MKTLIFDFDGTIADSYPLIWEIVDELLVANKLAKLTAKARKDIQNQGPREIIQKYHLPLIKLPFLLAKGKKMMNEKIKNISPIAGIGPMLKKLQQRGVKLGIVSSNSSASIQFFLKNNQLEFFDFIKTSSLFGKGNVLKKTLHQYKLDLNNTIYIGDEVRDIEVCQNIGLKIISVTWGFNTKSKLKTQKPDYLIDKPEEILKIV
jgi:phosphoglycolate phosphatase